MDYYKIATIILSVIVFLGMINRYCLTRSNNGALESMQKNINHNATALNLLVEEVEKLKEEFSADVERLGRRLTVEAEELLQIIRINDESQCERLSRFISKY